MIPLVKPYIPEREVLMPELEKILYSGYIAEGEAVYQFEAQFSKFIGNLFRWQFMRGQMRFIWLCYWPE